MDSDHHPAGELVFDTEVGVEHPRRPVGSRAEETRAATVGDRRIEVIVERYPKLEAGNHCPKSTPAKYHPAK